MAPRKSIDAWLRKTLEEGNYASITIRRKNGGSDWYAVTIQDDGRMWVEYDLPDVQLDDDQRIVLIDDKMAPRKIRRIDAWLRKTLRGSCTAFVL